MNGVGGQLIAGVWYACAVRGHVHTDEAAAGVRTGGDEDQVRKSGTRGNVSKRRVRERMREKGMMGSWTNACQGQLFGSSVRRTLYIPSPRNSFTANAP